MTNGRHQSSGGYSTSRLTPAVRRSIVRSQTLGRFDHLEELGPMAVAVFAHGPGGQFTHPCIRRVTAMFRVAQQHPEGGDGAGETEILRHLSELPRAAPSAVD